MNFSAFDLNLLHVFDVLLDERSVTRTGARLGLSQSAVSHALNRLRHMFGDELFHRTARGMSPTPRALETGPRIRAALAQLQAAISPSTFEPANTDRRFVLAAGPYACAVLAPALAARLADDAPRAQLVMASAIDQQGQLDSRRADFAITIQRRSPDRVAHEALFSESLVWAVGSDHFLAAKSGVTFEDLLSVPHVVVADIQPEEGRPVQAALEDQGTFEAELRSRGLRRTIGVVVPDTFSAMAMVRRSQMAALLPRKLAQMAQGGTLALIEPPYSYRTAEVALLYLRQRSGEPAMRWMRELIHEVAREAAADI